MAPIRTATAALALALLAACGTDNATTVGGTSNGRTNPFGSETAPVQAQAVPPAYTPTVHKAASRCADGSAPKPQEVINSTVTSGQIDFDTSVANHQDPATIHFSALLPERCPEDRFPLILHSHGYGGSRISAIAATPDLKAGDAYFSALTNLVSTLPHYGYIVVSFDERGHGQSNASKARGIDPAAETQDARVILDWAYDKLPVIAEDRKTGIAKDMKVGTIGLSYGGGFEFPLAALDGRIDAMAPNGTWHNLLYSLMPGDGVKLSLDGFLCLFASSGNVSNTPLIAALCNAVGPTAPSASFMRTRKDLADTLARPTGMPRPVAEAELDDFFFRHGTNYFEHSDQTAIDPMGNVNYGYPSNTTGPASKRKLPVLLMQGNRDVLFNITESARNFRYYRRAGQDVRMLTNEGGHMNPLAQQTEGDAKCGRHDGISSTLAWLDLHVRGIQSAAASAIPRVCISVTDTANAHSAKPAAVLLDEIPYGSLAGVGSITAKKDLSADLSTQAGTASAFLPITTITTESAVLAGIPTVESVTVTKGTGLPTGTPGTVAYVGVGIKRGGALILVDDQVTPFAEGKHTNNRAVRGETVVSLPGVGEQLQKGDEVGLIVYENHIQYSAVVSSTSAPQLPYLAGYLTGAPLPAVAPGPSHPNPYRIELKGVGLPILLPGQFPGSVLSK